MNTSIQDIAVQQGVEKLLVTVPAKNFCERIGSHYSREEPQRPVNCSVVSDGDTSFDITKGYRCRLEDLITGERAEFYVQDLDNLLLEKPLEYQLLVL